jgi:hypothetical protein
MGFLLVVGFSLDFKLLGTRISDAAEAFVNVDMDVWNKY